MHRLTATQQHITKETRTGSGEADPVREHRASGGVDEEHVLLADLRYQVKVEEGTFREVGGIPLEEIM